MIYSERLQIFLHAMDRPDCAGETDSAGGMESFRDEDSAGGEVSFRDEDSAGGMESFRDEDSAGGMESFRDEDSAGGEVSFQNQDSAGGRRVLRRDPDFEALRDRAGRDGVPIIRREMESFLQVLLEMIKPCHILEVGTATGYSAMRMASFTSEEVKITTIEKDVLRARQARSNFHQAKLDSRINLIEGDAEEVLQDLESEKYEFIFMDAAKGQYLHFLPQILRVLRCEGVLVSDNVLQDGMILEPRCAVEPRDRTIYDRMRRYLRTLKRTEGLVTSIVPIGDGASVTIKKKL